MGSDLLGPGFSQGLIEMGARLRLDLRVTMDGSLPAQGRLQSGAADLGLLLLGPDAAPPPEGYCSVPWAYWAVAVVVPVGNPIQAISLRQLASMFGPLESNSVQRWGELGLANPVWADRGLGLHVPIPSTGLTHDFFRHAVLGNRPYREKTTFHATPREALRSIAPIGIAVVPLAGIDETGDGVRILAIAVADKAVAHRPEAAALHRGDYPLRLPLGLSFPRSSAGRLLPLLQSLLSEEGVALAGAAGLIPLPPEVRRELADGLAKQAEDQTSAAAK